MNTHRSWMKNILALALAFVLLFGMSPMAFASEIGGVEGSARIRFTEGLLPEELDKLTHELEVFFQSQYDRTDLSNPSSFAQIGLRKIDEPEVKLDVQAFVRDHSLGLYFPQLAEAHLKLTDVGAILQGQVNVDEAMDQLMAFLSASLDLNTAFLNALEAASPYMEEPVSAVVTLPLSDETVEAERQRFIIRADQFHPALVAGLTNFKDSPELAAFLDQVEAIQGEGIALPSRINGQDNPLNGSFKKADAYAQLDQLIEEMNKEEVGVFDYAFDIYSLGEDEIVGFGFERLPFENEGARMVRFLHYKNEDAGHYQLETTTADKKTQAYLFVGSDLSLMFNYKENDYEVFSLYALDAAMEGPFALGRMAADYYQRERNGDEIFHVTATLDSRMDGDENRVDVHIIPRQDEAGEIDFQIRQRALEASEVKLPVEWIEMVMEGDSQMLLSEMFQNEAVLKNFQTALDNLGLGFLLGE